MCRSGAGPDTDGPKEENHVLFNRKSLRAACARIVDTMQHYPMVRCES
jgi:hypothetical protein